MRTIRTPALGIEPNDVIPVSQGGLGSTTVADAATALNAYKTSEINAPYGLLGLSSGKASATMFPGLSGVSIPVTGTTAIMGASSSTFTLKNYDIGTTYTLTKTGNGTVSSSLTVDGSYAATFTYTAPATKTGGVVGNDTVTITAVTNGISTSRTISMEITDLSRISFTNATGTTSYLTVNTSINQFTKADGTAMPLPVTAGTIPFTKADGTSTSIPLTA